MHGFPWLESPQSPKVSGSIMGIDGRLSRGFSIGKSGNAIAGYCGAEGDGWTTVILGSK